MGELQSESSSSDSMIEEYKVQGLVSVDEEDADESSLSLNKDYQNNLIPQLVHENGPYVRRDSKSSYKSSFFPGTL